MSYIIENFYSASIKNTELMSLTLLIVVTSSGLGLLINRIFSDGAVQYVAFSKILFPGAEDYVVKLHGLISGFLYSVVGFDLAPVVKYFSLTNIISILRLLLVTPLFFIFPFLLIWRFKEQTRVYPIIVKLHKKS